MKYVCLGYLEPRKFENMSESERNTVLDECFSYNDELRKMAADIAVRGRTARIRGIERLRGAAVTCTDVRAAAALVLAGLGARGETTLDGLDHLDRGYDGMTAKLAACGADVTRR